MVNQSLEPDIVHMVMRELGRQGGAKSNPRKGFGSSGLASDAGRKGAIRRWERYRHLRDVGKKI